MTPGLKRLPAHFYRSDSGREPVREWLTGLEAEDRKVIGGDIKDVEFSWPIGMPLVGSLGRELWEVRSRAARPHCTGSFLRRARAYGAASRLHQEDSKDPATRPRSGT
jgi:hypothetical protein